MASNSSFGRLSDEHSDLDDDDGEISLSEILAALRSRWKLLVLGPLTAGALAVAGTYAVAPTYTAVTRFLPPQQNQSGAASALASLGALGGLASGVANVKSPLDQYVSLMQSAYVSDRIIDRFKLQAVYESQFRVDAQRRLGDLVRIAVGKKDSLITVEVEDTDPQRAADVANQYVEELRSLTASLAVTEAQQRRVFFERQWAQTRDQLAKAQQALQGSGFNPNALKAEPKSAAESFARLKAELSAAEARLVALRGSFAESAAEIRQQQALVSALRDQFAAVVAGGTDQNSSDYIGRYREYRYQETLYELYARQFELARADEAREGALIQVVDVASKPERKTKPRRGLVGGIAFLSAGLLLAIFAIASRPRRRVGA